MLSLCRRLISSTELAAVSLLIVALVLLGIPLRVSLASSVLLIVAVVWQCAVGISIWVRVIKPTRVELVDILGPCLATGAAFTALGWFALCRISWITPRLFALSTVVVAIDGVRLLKTRYQKSDDRQTPVIAVSIAILGLGYHRIALLALGVGLLTLLIITNAVKPSLKTSLDKSFVEKFATTKKLVISTTGLLMVICAMALQALISRNNIVGYIPNNDVNFSEAIALGIAPNTNLDLSPFNSNFRYHWLSHGWLGVMIRSFKLEPFVGTAVLVPLIVLTSTVCLVFSAFKKWRGSGVLIPIITAMLIVAGCSVSDQLVFATDGSTSNQFGTLWLLLGGFYLFYFLNDCKPNHFRLVGTFLIGFLLMASKGPLALVLISAAISHMLYSIFEKIKRLQSIQSLVGLIIGAITAYLVLVSSPYKIGGLSFSKPASNLTGYRDFFYFITLILFTRVPLLFAPAHPTTVNSNRFLATGAAGMGISSFVFKTEGINIVYFATGAIALANFFGGLSADLIIKKTRYLVTVINCATSIIFFSSLFYHSKKIYLSALPKSLSGELVMDYVEKLLNLQKFLILVFVSLILGGLAIRQLNNWIIHFVLISVMLATTFGIFVADANSSYLRQRATDNYGLNGGSENSAISNQALIVSAKWIKTHSNPNAIVATNYSVNSGGTPFLVSVVSQRPVLIESNSFIFPTLFVSDSEMKVKATIEFFDQPNSSTAKVLTDRGVTWYLVSTADEQISSPDLCAENEIWRCEYKNKYSVVLKFLTKN